MNTYKSPTVKIYDFATKRVTIIPRSELAPGMVEAFFQGLGEKLWIDPHKVPNAPIRHPKFDKKRRGQLRQIMGILKKVDRRTINEWEDGFRRETHPDAEIAIVLRLAKIYEGICKGLTLPQKLELYAILMQCSGSSYEHIREVIAPETLPHATVTRAIEAYYGEPILKELATRKPAIEYPDILGNTPSSVELLRTLEGRAKINDVQIILGVDSFSGETSVFFGRDSLEKITKSGEAATVLTASYLYDSRTDQLDLLVAAVREAKGSCCYP
jgi:hypothetical protein